MKVIQVHQFGGPEVLKSEELATPQPAGGQLLVRAYAIGVNPVETYIRAGAYAVKPALPYIPGKDAAGIVEAVGTGVTKFKVGDRVYLNDGLTGAYAEHILCTATQAHALPDALTYAQGAAIGVPYATAYRALFHKARAEAGETVLIHGATGGVGIAAIQLARAAGLKIIGTGGTEAGLQLIKEQGATEALNHLAPDFAPQLLALTGGSGVDLILEMAAHLNLGKDLALLAKDGRVVVVGSRGPVEINPRDAMTRDASIIAFTLLNTTPLEMAEIHAALGSDLANGNLHPVVGREFKLAEAALAHKAVLEPGAHGKIVLIP